MAFVFRAPATMPGALLSALLCCSLILAPAASARSLPRSGEVPTIHADGARAFADGASYALCFTPDGASCQGMLVDAIRSARRSVLVQAYSFTSKPIAQALMQARKRGVDVRVILDKSQVSQRYTSATFLKHQGIEVLIDSRPAIAHNKVMIFDGEAVFTGSFNFTKSAEERNTENGILIRGDGRLVKRYVDNWQSRERLSMPY